MLYGEFVSVATQLAATAPSPDGGSSGDAGSGFDAITSFVPYLNFGLLVVLAVAFITKKWIVPKWVLDDVTASYEARIAEIEKAQETLLKSRDGRIESLEAEKTELKALNGDLLTYQRDQLQPALIESSRIIATYVSALSSRGGTPT